ncbi:MAG: VCBS repeat-containing protein [Nannocystaceae bacterium]|nr:VCBS repeat-containing protein [Nannocystaceae bacterium]
MRTLKPTLGLKVVPTVLAGAALVALAPTSAMAMEPFVNSSAQLNNANAHSGAPMAVADMNADGLDDIVRLDGNRFLEIEYQQEDGSFTMSERLDTMVDSWSMAIADIDGNGYNDIFTGDAFNNKVVYLANEDGTGYTRNSLPGPGIFVQCSSFADINNDGDLDFFVCADTSKSLVYHGDGTGALSNTYETLDPVSTVPSDNSGNYGNVWSDYDLDGDVDLYISKCRQGVNNANSGERLNLLFENNGDGTYSEVSEARGLLPRGQTWASDFADIDNDGDIDAFILNHEVVETDAASDLYTNDGNNEYTAIADAAGIRGALNAVGTGIQTHFADFDNDGYQDLLISSGGGSHQFLLNNGDATFTADNGALPAGSRMQSFGIGDLNNDGSLDIVAGFGSGFNAPSSNPDLLLLNPGNENHWLKVHLTGVESNPAAIGAVIQITGSWGTQTREIRAGESYGISHSLIEHFGLGADETAATVTITWPSGQVDTIENVDGDQTIDVTEGCGTEFFADEDEDGFGEPGTGEAGCIATAGRVADNTDCDDDDGNNYPGNDEVCDGSDNNCDGDADEGLADCNAGTSSGGGESEGDASSGDGPTSDSESTTTGPVDPTSAGTTGDSETDTDDSAGAGGGGGGCSVSAPSTDATFLLMLLGFGLAPLARRRKRC